MGSIAHLIVRLRWVILAVCLILLLPALYGLQRQKIEYDLMTYLPADTPSVVGQRVLDTEFGFGSTAFLMVKNKEDWEVEQLKEDLSALPGVSSVTWVDDLVDIVVPRGYVDPKILDQFYQGDATILQLAFSAGGSSPELAASVKAVKALLDKDESLAGQAVTLVEMQESASSERPKILLISVALVTIVLLLAVPSPIVPFLFLFTLGFSIAANLGINYYFGYHLSYLTNSIVTALQLGVSLDFCIFLWERYKEERNNCRTDKKKAMEIAIRRTATAVMASSLTTVFGFLALAAMTITLGADLGVTMARGVLISLFACLTVLPALLLIFDRPIFAWQHRSAIPSLGFLAPLIAKARIPLFLIFLLLLVPAYHYSRQVDISYDLESTFPSDLPSIVAANEMSATFGTVDTVNLVSKGLEPYELDEIVAKIESVPGVKQVTSYQELVDPTIPDAFVPQVVKDRFIANGYLNTTILLAERASTPVSAQAIIGIQNILRPYGERALLTGQAAITEDMATSARTDLPRVNTLSMVLILIVLATAFLSVFLPPLLVLAVELAIWINQSIAFFTGQEIFYFGVIAIGAIQLGATIDYAVLLTSRFREELKSLPPVEAMIKAFRESVRAILTSATTLFVATMGIYIASSLDLVKDLVLLIARGAIVTVFVIVFIFPAVLLVCNKLIGISTIHWPGRRRKHQAQPHEGDLPCTITER